MFQPISTERLVIRAVEADDVEPLWRRRNEPTVALYQNWTIPVSRDRAEQIVAGTLTMEGPTDEEWWMATVTLPDGEVVGELVTHLTSGGRSAEVGYTFASDHWGRGYATESLGAFVRYLFDEVEVTRVWAMLHPDNLPSAQVLERTGLLFEGHTRQSFWLDDEVSDDWIYGMVREDWQAWLERPRHRPESVELVEVTRDNIREVYGLETHRSQQRFVAPVPWSLAQALVPPAYDRGVPIPWYRAIAADGTIVGFVMVALSDDSTVEPMLWRLLIDRKHQRRGIASDALDLVEQEIRTRGAAALLTSWVPGRGSPEPFYLGRGYEPTGEVEHDEIVGRKVL